MSDVDASCTLCANHGGLALWCNAFCRVVLVDDPGYPGFCRVILNRHVREMTDLAPTDQHSLMEVVFAVERALRQSTDAEKINLASLGNQTPHLHWHVIPRWRDDPTFPDPIWAPRHRQVTHPHPGVDKEHLRQALINLLGPSTISSQQETP